MAYIKVGPWNNGSSPFINAANLDQIEDGLVTAAADADAAVASAATNASNISTNTTNITNLTTRVDDIEEGIGFNVKDATYGAVGDGVTDDTVAIQAAIDAAVAAGGGIVLFPAGTYITTAKLTHNTVTASVIIKGSGQWTSILKASGNFSALFELGATSATFFCEDMGLVTTGTTTSILDAVVGSQQYYFNRNRMNGDGSGTKLIKSAGQLPFFTNNVITMGAVNTVGIEIDGYNQNCRIVGNRFGGVGRGVNIINTQGAANDAEGVLIAHNVFFNTGDYNVQIGDSFFTQLVDNLFDQAAVYAIHISTDADKVLVADNWIALPSGNTTGACVDIAADAGNRHKIEGNTMSQGNRGVIVRATASESVDGVDIINNSFSGHSGTTIQLDSVNNCKVKNNDDTSTPTNGSWQTLQTRAGFGEYWFDGNSWHTTAPANFATGATYYWGFDKGIVGRAEGVDTPGAAATTLVVNHGLFRIPTVVRAQPMNANAGDNNTQGFSSTQFTIAWQTSGTPDWYWEARV